MLATLLIWLSVAVALLALADLLLSKAQKDWLCDAVVKLWTILDEAKGWSFADWVKQPRAIWWLAISLGLITGIWVGWLEWTYKQAVHMLESGPQGEGMDDWRPLDMDFFLMAIVGCILTLLARPIFARLLKFSSGKALARKLAKISLLALIVYAISYALRLALINSSLEWLAIVSVFLLGIPSSIVLLCLLAILVARALAYIASAILYVGEFTIRRIAEYPKGPVIAVSAFFGAIVALIKAFG